MDGNYCAKWVRFRRNSTSDRRAAGEDINTTKKRLADEIEAEPQYSHVWITEGREIENYLDQAFISQSFNSVVPNFEKLIKRSIANKALFNNVLEFVGKESKKASASHKKVAFARAYVEHSQGAIPADAGLNTHLDAVVRLIKKANGVG